MHEFIFCQWFKRVLIMQQSVIWMSELYQWLSVYFLCCKLFPQLFNRQMPIMYRFNRMHVMQELINLCFVSIKVLHGWKSV